LVPNTAPVLIHRIFIVVRIVVVKVSVVNVPSVLVLICGGEVF
jgi:hypothetical protein